MGGRARAAILLRDMALGDVRGYWDSDPEAQLNKRERAIYRELVACSDVLVAWLASEQEQLIAVGAHVLATLLPRPPQLA